MAVSVGRPVGRSVCRSIKIASGFCITAAAQPSLTRLLDGQPYSLNYFVCVSGSLRNMSRNFDNFLASQIFFVISSTQVKRLTVDFDFVQDAS